MPFGHDVADPFSYPCINIVQQKKSFHVLNKIEDDKNIINNTSIDPWWIKANVIVRSLMTKEENVIKSLN
jgi:hypothetical protein